MDLRFQTTDLALYEGEPRIADVKLGVVLGYDRPRKVRELIERNRDELVGYGSLAPHGGAATEYLLNEGQALVVCSLSRTTMAVQVRRALIDVFMAWRRGALAPQAVALSPNAQTYRIRAAKLRFAEATCTLDSLGVDVTAFNMNAVLNFGRGFLSAR